MSLFNSQFEFLSSLSKAFKKFENARLRLHGIGYVQIRLGSDPLCLHGTGSKLERYGSFWDHLQKWTHLVPDGRSDLYQIHQVSCKHKATLFHGIISHLGMVSE